MKLPNYERAVVPQAKIEDYLLAATHQTGHSKAKFFTRFGFSRDSWETLAESLLQHAANHEVAKVEPSPFGTRYVIEGELQTPVGRRPFVRSVWFVGEDENLTRFVTAYPLVPKEDDNDTRA